MLIYLSYDQNDKQHGDRLKKGLIPFTQQLGFTIWSKQDIIPGRNWQHDMATHLKQAALFIPLISADFLASPQCQAEVQGAIRLIQQGQPLTLLPVLIRPCTWEYSSLARYPILPQDRVEITMKKNKDKAWKEVQQEIIASIQRQLPRG